MAGAPALRTPVSVGRPEARLPVLASRALHIFVLASLSIAAPALAVIDAQFFVGRGADASDVLATVIVVGLVPPAALVVLDSLAGLASARMGAAIHQLLVGLLVALFASQALHPIDLGLGVHLVLALAVGGAASAAYARTEGVRSVITALTPVPFLALAYLLLLSPVSKIVLAGEEEASAAATDTHTPVVVVIFDELPGYALMNARGEVDRERFPAFGRLAEDATWYRNATTSRSDTELAVPTLVTGRHAPLGSVPIAAEHPRSLFTLLAKSHRMHVSEPWTNLCPDRLCAGGTASLAEGGRGSLLATIPEILGHLYLPDAERLGIPNPRESGAVSRAAQVRTFVDEVEPGRRPALHLLHVLLPHKAWRYLPSGRRYPDQLGGQGALADFDRMVEESWPARQYQQRFLLQLRFTDRLLGELTERLRAAGLYDRALIVVAADHGVSFRPGESRRDATESNAEDILSIPLFVKPPGQRRGEADDGPAHSVDIVPTVADALDIAIPWPVDGRSLLDELPADRPHRIENQAGGVVELSPRQFARRRDAALRRQVAFFGDGRWNLYAIGPHRDLIGLGTAALEAGPADAKATIVDGGAVRSYAPGSEVVPARIAGRLDGLEAKRPMALALDGRVVATTYSYDGSGDVEFSAMVHPRRLRAGDNRLSVLEIARSSGGLLLRPLDVEY